MKVIIGIEDQNVIKKILKHLELWDIKARPPPEATGPQKRYFISSSFSIPGGTTPFNNQAILSTTGLRSRK